MLKAVQSARSFPPAEQREIVVALAEAYNLQMKILIGFSALQIFVIAMIWRRGEQIRVVDVKEVDAGSSGASVGSGGLRQLDERAGSEKAG